jgi:hypothetical protein
MARPRTLEPEQVRHIFAQPKTREAREALGKQYGIHPRSIASIQLGYSYADITGGAAPIHRKLPGDEILRRRYAGESTRSIAESLNTSTGSIRAKIGRYCRATGMPWPKPDKSGPKNTSPSDARQPSRGSGVTAPSHSTTKAHSGGDVTGSGAAIPSAASEGRDCGHGRASPETSPAATPTVAGPFSGKHSSAGKAKGGRTTSRQNSYYRIHGAKQREHDRAREAARKTDTNACMACQSAPVAKDGLCIDCASVVQRARPAAAYGAEPGNLSRASSGTEADNVILSEVEI